MAESIVVKGQGSCPPLSTEILNVTWADWLNSIPTKVCYRINNWVFIKVRFYNGASPISSTNNIILNNLPYSIPESLRRSDCLPIGEYSANDYNISKHLEGYTDRMGGTSLSFYTDSGLIQNLINCYYLNIDFCYEIEE